MDEIVALEMAVLPGMDEMANLLYILDYYEGAYDVPLSIVLPPARPCAC
jgi:anion-transporting  ArsA/GET3 family ATPase